MQHLSTGSVYTERFFTTFCTASVPVGVLYVFVCVCIMPKAYRLTCMWLHLCLGTIASRLKSAYLWLLVWNINLKVWIDADRYMTHYYYITYPLSLTQTIPIKFLRQWDFKNSLWKWQVSMSNKMRATAEEIELGVHNGWIRWTLPVVPGLIYTSLRPNHLASVECFTQLFSPFLFFFSYFISCIFTMKVKWQHIPTWILRRCSNKSLQPSKQNKTVDHQMM